MTLQRDFSLAELNTLGVPARAAFYARIDRPEALVATLADADLARLPRLVLGGGSNLVLRGDFPGLVLHLALRGIHCEVQGNARLVTVAAGENWDALVRYSLAQGWYGLENLIAIPGSVGAAPIQNIGAYGVELADILVAVSGWDLNQRSWRRLDRQQCQLGYRDSVFKGALRDRFIITEVELRLSAEAAVNLSYPALADAMPAGQLPTPETVAATVDALRASRLPDYRREPNTGSFFKNPIISAPEAEALQQRFADLVCWPMADGRVKLAAAWLVDQCGWKGRREDGVGVHSRQAIVLVNYARESGEAVLALAARIQEDVWARFGVRLELEPRVY